MNYERFREPQDLRCCTGAKDKHSIRETIAASISGRYFNISVSRIPKLSSMICVQRENGEQCRSKMYSKFV